MATVNGGSGNDTLPGTGASDEIYGGDGNDLIQPTGMNDTIYGGADDDTIVASAGNDTIFGGTGLDTYDLTGDGNSGATVDLGAGTASGAGIGTDTLTEVENVVGGDGDDDITGSAEANILEGGGGDDTLRATGDGDTLDGGAGTDTADYSGEAGPVTVDLGAGTATRGGETDTLISIENVIGTAAGDTLTGSAADETLEGGLGDDTIDGGAGIDVARIDDNGFAGFNAGDYDTSGLSVSGGVVSGTLVGPSGTDTLAGIEVLEVTNTGSSTFIVLPGMSINAAIAAASAGDTIYIAPGTYNEEVDVTKSLTFVGAGDGTDPLADTILTGGGKVSEGNGIGTVFTISADDVTIENLRIQDAGEGIALSNGFSNLTVTDATIYNTDSGIFAAGPVLFDGITVTGTTFDFNDIGLHNLNGGDGGTLSNVSFDDVLFFENRNGAVFSEGMETASFTNITATENGLGTDDNYVFQFISVHGGNFTDITFDGFAISNAVAAEGAFSIEGYSAGSFGAPYGDSTVSNFVIQNGTVDNLLNYIRTNSETSELTVTGVTPTNIVNFDYVNRGDFDGPLTIAGDRFAADTRDNIMGREDDDSLDGGGGADSISGEGGDDRISGGTGNDAIGGGAGTDTAVYSGNLADYSFTALTGPDGRATGFTGVTDNNAGDGDEGTDTLTSIERLEFADGVVDVARPVHLFDGLGNLAGTFDTIQAAVDAASADYTVLVDDGTYTENVVIDVPLTLLSVNGRGSTIIEGISGVGALGTVRVLNGVDGVTIGDTGQGFHIVGIDNGLPGVENAAVYLQGSQDGFTLRDNEIEAAGEAGLLSEYGGALTNAVIDGNEFSGQTFLGANPAGIGFSQQFTIANVPRQLVVIGPAGTSSNVEFTNNLVSGITGGISSDDGVSEQGNTMVTIDVGGATISGNDFTGITARFATALRARGPETDIENNTFDNSADGDTRGVFVQDQGAPGSYAGNAFIGGTDDDLFTGMTPGADTATGGDGDDVFFGAAGDDTIDGGADDDTALYEGSRDGYDLTVTTDAQGFVTGISQVEDLTGDSPTLDNLEEGTDTLTSIERLEFSDAVIDLGHPVQLFDDGGALVGTFETIQAGIDAAADGFTLRVAAGAYAENIEVDVAVTIIGEVDGSGDPAVTVGTGSGPAITVSANAPGEDVSLQGLATAAGASRGVTVSTGAALDSLTLDNMAIAGASGAGFDLNDADGVLAVAILNSAFTQNALGQANVGDVVFFEYHGDITITDTTITGAALGSGNGDRAANAIQIAGFDQATYDVTQPIGTVTIDGLAIEGSYRKPLVMIQGYQDLAGLSFAASSITGESGWGDLLFIDPVGSTGQDAPGTGGYPGFFDAANGGTDIALDLSGITVTQQGSGTAEAPFGIATPTVDVRHRGTDADDVVTGTNARDLINNVAEGNNDLGGDDVLSGLGGNDVFVGGAGDDSIDGGADFDTAIYEGSRDGYDVTYTTDANGFVVSFQSVEDLTGDSPTLDTLEEGTDTLTSVEALLFNDATLSVGDPVQLFDENDVLVGTFGDLESAVMAASADFTIRLSAGDIADTTDGDQILIDKDLTIIGAGKGTSIVKSSFDTGTSGDARGWFNVAEGVTLDVQDVTFDGDGQSIYQAFRHRGSGSFDNVEFTDIQYNASGPHYQGVAVAVFGSVSAVDITNSDFSDIGRIGVLYFGAGVTGTFEGNTYTGKGAGDWLDYALDISAGADIDVIGNQVSGNLGVASSDGSTSAAFLVSTFFGPGTDAIFTDNVLDGNTTGFAIGFDLSDGSTVDMTTGNVVTNGTGAVVRGNAVVANADSLDGDYKWFGGAAANAVTGADEADTLEGGGAADTITGNGGDDIIRGDAGDDNIFAGAGEDQVFWSFGDGNDSIDGGADDDTATFTGQAGALTDFDLTSTGTAIGIDADSADAATVSAVEDLVINAGNGGSLDVSITGDFTGTGLATSTITINGGSGNDSVDASGLTSAHAIVFDAGDGADSFHGGAGADLVYGGDGADTLAGGAGADSLDGGAGYDIASYAGAAAEVYIYRTTGTGRNDAAGDTYSGIEAFELTGFADLFFGSGDDETVFGGDGNDYLVGGAGADRLVGGTGFNYLDGADGGGADILDGTDGVIDIAFYYGATTDLVFDFVNPANNVGEHASDTFIGIEGVVGAGAHGNTMTGGTADEWFVGGEMTDSLFGGGGADRLEGNGGDDEIFGGAGIDVMFGGRGTDELTGGAGETDVFGIRNNSQIDIIKDWDEAYDQILFDRMGISNYSQLSFDDTTQAGNVLITSTVNSTFTVVVENATLSDLDDMDSFIFIL